MAAGEPRTTGVLALQGDHAAHRAALESCGARVTEVRRREDLDVVEALVIPGGESTTILKMIDRHGLREDLIARIRGGLPVFGTCAGAIVMAKASSDGEEPLGVLDLEVVRNAYGRQSESFEAGIDVEGIGRVQGVFIRAPAFTAAGPGVEVLATRSGWPVLVRQGRLLAASFHPEIAGDYRIHRWFLEEVAGGGRDVPSGSGPGREKV